MLIHNLLIALGAIYVASFIAMAYAYWSAEPAPKGVEEAEIEIERAQERERAEWDRDNEPDRFDLAA
jgi:hypothetical protein